MPSSTLQAKVRRIQRALPVYVAKQGGSQAGPLAERLERSLKKEEFEEAEAAADALLRLLETQP